MRPAKTLYGLAATHDPQVLEGVFLTLSEAVLFCGIDAEEVDETR